MPTLSALPVELQRSILEKCDFSSLCALIFTCRAIWPVATEYLYRKIVWEGETGWTCRNIQLLFRTFIEDPQLALMVDTLDLGPRESNFGFTNRYEYPNDVGRADIDMAIYEQATETLRTMEIPDPESWSDDLKSGSLDPWIALLISRCRRLQSLTLAPPLVHRSKYLGIILIHLVRPHSRHFDRLRHVKLGKDGEALDLAGLHISRWIIVALLFLPALDHLELTLSSPLVESWPAKRPEMPLKTLALWQSNVSCEDLNGLLELAPMLQVFRCGFLRDRGNLQDSDLVDFDELCLTLEPVSDTLKSLRLDVRWLSTNTERVGEIRSVNPSDVLATPLHAFPPSARL
ncbi:hypothetical protein BJX62DRAFT_245240 [Aspergillus germanicus]